MSAKTRRIFTFNGTRFQDPSPSSDVSAVKTILSAQYPELANATMTLKGTEEKNGTSIETWEFVKKVGTKG